MKIKITERESSNCPILPLNVTVQSTRTLCTRVCRNHANLREEDCFVKRRICTYFYFDNEAGSTWVCNP